MSATLQYQEVLQAVECVSCGVSFAMPMSLYNKRLEDHKAFWCPNGHGGYFPRETEAEKLAKQLVATRAQLDQKEMAIRDSRREAERAHKETAKIKRWATAALCPCCNRSFVQLRRHIAAKHPDIAHKSFEKEKTAKK
jgi:Zn ribbon nucleic-acid-binding protein